jgi:hypothetical protein
MVLVDYFSDGAMVFCSVRILYSDYDSISTDYVAGRLRAMAVQ